MHEQGIIINGGVIGNNKCIFGYSWRNIKRAQKQMGLCNMGDWEYLMGYLRVYDKAVLFYGSVYSLHINLNLGIQEMAW